MGQIRLLVILTIIGVIQGYELILILTNGGPGYSTMVPGLHMYLSGFSFNRLGYACAIGLVLFLIILSLTLLNLKYLKASEEFSAR
jgi:raffinose/stachyose/melibiose transport system permease protein